MIGFIKQPTGRLGNVLLQYLFLREVSFKTGVPYFHGSIKGSQYFEGLEETSNFASTKRGIILNKSVDNPYINNIGIDQFINFVEDSKRNIVLQPAVLGHTFETMYENPNEFLRIRPELKKPYFDYAGKFVIALHFRGTDFSTWNPVACLDAQYYIDAIDYCASNYSNENLLFSIFTDDLSIDSYKRTIDYIKAKNYCCHEGNPDRNLGEECYNLSMSNIVISSPSTFAITASLIGKRKRVIHAKSWCDYCVSKDDKVWVQMLQNKCDFYKIEKLL